MLKKSLFFLLLFGSLTGAAQTKKLELFCDVSESGVNYGMFSKLLPDSLKPILINIKEYKFTDPLDMMMLLTMHDWKLVNTTQRVDNTSFRGNYSRISFLLKKEIEISEAAHTQLLQKMKTLYK